MGTLPVFSSFSSFMPFSLYNTNVYVYVCIDKRSHKSILNLIIRKVVSRVLRVCVSVVYQYAKMQEKFSRSVAAHRGEQKEKEKRNGMGLILSSLHKLTRLHRKRQMKEDSKSMQRPKETQTMDHTGLLHHSRKYTNLI